MTLTVGIDIGGTKLIGGVVDEAGRVVATARRASPAADAEAIEEAIEQIVHELSGEHEVVAVGVGAAGFIDVQRSRVLFAPNLAWRDEPLKRDLEARLDLPVVVENDANAAAWGEYRFGVGGDEGIRDLLLVTVGTGIGGGIILDGALHRGAFGIAAEFGHQQVVPDGRVCGCGNTGCWEQYASGNALLRNAIEAMAAGSPAAAELLQACGGDITRLTGPMISAAASAGDEFAIEQIANVGRWLGIGIANLAAVLDPAMVVVGGGVSESGRLLLKPARDEFRRRLTGRGHRPELTIAAAALGNTAGMIGAADLARTI